MTKVNGENLYYYHLKGVFNSPMASIQDIKWELEEGADWVLVSKRKLTAKEMFKLMALLK